MTNWDLYSYIHGGKSGSNATVDGIIDRSIKSSIKNNRVTKIGTYAFRECYQLSSVDFSNVASIGTYAFRDCYQLSSVNFPNVASIGDYAFRDCYQLSSVDFPNVTSIGDYAFYNCYPLSSVDFPNVTSIGAYAFYNCSRLASIKLASSQVVTLKSANAFERTPFASGAGYIYVPNELVESYKTATNWVTYANRIKGISGPEGT